jgi:hypothetical protein
VVSNVMVEIDNERHSATARSYYTAFQARPELQLQPILAGRFTTGWSATTTVGTSSNG